MIVPLMHARNEHARDSVCGTLATTSKRYEAQLPLLVPHGTLASGEQHAGGVRTADERLISRKGAKTQRSRKGFHRQRKIDTLSSAPYDQKHNATSDAPCRDEGG